jgi:hypothetical protein
MQISSYVQGHGRPNFRKFRSKFRKLKLNIYKNRIRFFYVYWVNRKCMSLIFINLPDTNAWVNSVYTTKPFTYKSYLSLISLYFFFSFLNFLSMLFAVCTKKQNTDKNKELAVSVQECMFQLHVSYSLSMTEWSCSCLESVQFSCVVLILVRRGFITFT